MATFCIVLLIRKYWNSQCRHTMVHILLETLQSALL
jgi:hypothetical protein